MTTQVIFRTIKHLGLVLLVLLFLSSIPSTAQFLSPVIILLIFVVVMMISLAAQINSLGNAGSTLNKKWVLIGGGVVGLVILIFWADWIWGKIQTSGFSFATDVGLGRMLASHYGESAAQVLGWVLFTFLILLLTAPLWRLIPWKSIVPMVIAAALSVFIFFLISDEVRHWSFQNDARKQEQARLDDFYQRGPLKQVQIPDCENGWAQVEGVPGWSINWALPVKAEAFNRNTGWIRIPENGFVENAKKFRFCSGNRALVGVIMDLNPKRYP